MKRFISALLITLITLFAVNNSAFAQNGGEEPDTSIVADDDTSGMGEESIEEEKPIEEEEVLQIVDADKPLEDIEPEGFHQVLRTKFIEGNAGFMSFVLICLILGLAFSIERIITINLASADTKKLMVDVDNALKAGDTDQAKEICRATRGPVASILFQGLERKDEGIETVEKSIIAYGSVQMGLLEKGLVWISLFISLAPMLGFMGTVIGIKVALITTVFGLIVAIILQVFYNYIISKIDDIVNNMEDSSITFVDMMIKYNITK